MRKVLVISYYFPPSGGPGVQRIVKFCRHLPAQGWQPVVLTVTETADFPVLDPGLARELPAGLPVYRSGIFEPYALFRKITGKAATEKLDVEVLSSAEQQKKSLGMRLAFFIRTWLFIPDARIGWLFSAVWLGLRAIGKEKIDVIFSSAPPNTGHLIALVLKKLTGRPWIADFRDPWFKYLVPQRTAALPRRLDAWMGRKVLEAADQVVVVCEGVKKELLADFNTIRPDKIIVISNGYDQERFARLPKTAKSDQFRLCYVGSVYLYYDFSGLIAAISQLWQERADFRRDFVLEIYGRVDERVAASLKAAVFAESIGFGGYLPLDQALQKMTEASALCLYIIDSERGKNIPTSKLFEYIGAGRPIFALAPADSDAADIIRGTGNGVVVPPAAAATIQAELLNLYQAWCKNPQFALAANPEGGIRYEIRSLTQQLARLFMTSSVSR